MEEKDIRDRIDEFENIRNDAGDDAAALLEVALFVEDVFGIPLKDADICEKNLGTHQAVGKFVLKKFRDNSPCAESAE